MIYVCIPSRDEAATLGPVLWKVQKVFRAFGREFRLVVLDDASTDETGEILERYRDHLPLDVIRSDEHLGYGRAVDRLLRHVVEEAPYPKRDAAVVLQADLTEDPAALEELVKMLEGGADVVAGSAVDLPEDAPSPLRWGRRLAPWVLGRAWKGAPVRDPLCGLRAYRVIVLRKALRDDDSPFASAAEPWVANLQLLRRVSGFARRVEDLPLTTRYGLLARASRFRTVPVLRSLLGMRRLAWTPDLLPRDHDASGSDGERAA